MNTFRCLSLSIYTYFIIISDLFENHFQASILFSVPWSIGAVTDPDGREKFSNFLRELMHGKNEEYPVPKSIGKLEAPIPDSGLVYDYCYEVCLFIFVTRSNNMLRTIIF